MPSLFSASALSRLLDKRQEEMELRHDQVKHLEAKNERLEIEAEEGSQTVKMLMAENERLRGALANMAWCEWGCDAEARAALAAGDTGAAPAVEGTPEAASSTGMASGAGGSLSGDTGAAP
jgi:hypothetical protein